MKEIKQYLVVYWTLTNRTESLEVLFSNIKMKEKKTSFLQNLEEKKIQKRKTKEQIRLDSKFLFILPSSTRSPKTEKKTITEQFTLTKMSNAVAAPFKLNAKKNKVGRDCNFH